MNKDAFDLRRLLADLRTGAPPTEGSLARFIEGAVAGTVDRGSIGAFLALVFVRGLDEGSLVELTRVMLHSGAVLDFKGLGRPIVDKHSTGGIGDKVSLPLAPALAACGCAVPMISGRGLGHTGGTLDKLEAIPGMRTDIDPARYRAQLEDVGVVFGAQTDAIAPADKLLYALRDVTGLVESIALITSSILAKKIAEGLDALVLDVKFGSGAFLPEVERGAELARTLVRVAAHFGVRAVAWQTNMARPLGRTIGHTLEVEESVHCLTGRGPSDLRELVCLFGGEALTLAGVVSDSAEGRHRIARSLDDGSALEVFARTVHAQGGDGAALFDPTRMAMARHIQVLGADRAGYLAFRDLRALGRALLALGGGRHAVADPIDHSVGMRLLVAEGEHVEEGQGVLEIHHRGRGLAAARRELGAALSIEAEPPTALPLALARFDGAP